MQNLASNYGDKEAQPSSLSKAIDQLHNDAKQIRDGQLSDPKQLAPDFAQANIDLAQHFQAAADRSLQNSKQVRAGYQLDNAASALRAAMAWSGRTPDQQGIQAIDQARSTAAQLLGPDNEMSGQSQNRQASGQGSSGQGASGQVQSGQQNQGSQASGSNQDPKQASQALAQEIRKVEAQIAQNSNGQNQGSSNQNSGNASGR